MAKKLTQLSVAAAKPLAFRREIADGGCRGLYLIVQPNGRKSWAVRYRVGGKPTKLTLGGVDSILLTKARAMAANALEQVARSIDAAAEKKSSGPRARSWRRGTRLTRSSTGQRSSSSAHDLRTEITQ